MCSPQTIQKAAAVPTAEEIYVPKMFQGDLWSGVLAAKVVDHFRKTIPFDAVQKTVEKAGNIDITTDAVVQSYPFHYSRCQQ